MLYFLVFNIEECVDCKHCQLLLHNNPVLKTGKHQIDLLGESVDVYCDMETDGGGWTVSLSRDIHAWLPYLDDIIATNLF